MKRERISEKKERHIDGKIRKLGEEMHAESPGLVEYGKKRGKTELRIRKEG